MIIVRCVGGLGNQMFQYAAGLRLARAKGTELVLDTVEYDWDSKRDFRLNCFEGTLNLAGFLTRFRFQPLEALAHYLFPRRRTLFSKFIISFLRKTLFRHHIWKKALSPFSEAQPGPLFIQPCFHYYDEFLALPDPCYLVGFWSSERFFAPIANELRKAFTFHRIFRQLFQSLTEQMAQQESVSIHVRRGDKLRNANYSVSNTFFIRSAMQMISARIASPRYFLFSDDPIWAAHEFQDLGSTMTIVSGQLSHNEQEDLYLMSHCRYNIIAASTFSWWAAWLNTFPDKIVIAPSAESWFPAKAPEEVRDLLPASWIQLPQES